MPDTDSSNPVWDESQQDSEMPREHRSRILKKAKVLFKEGLRSAPCIVRNISDSGARLEYEQAYLVPKEFELRIELEGFEVTCERRWEDGLTCGVQFISEKRPIKQQRSQVLKPSDRALPTKSADEDFDSLAAAKSASGHDRNMMIGKILPARNSGKPFGKR